MTITLLLDRRRRLSAKLRIKILIFIQDDCWSYIRWIRHRMRVVRWLLASIRKKPLVWYIHVFRRNCFHNLNITSNICKICNIQDDKYMCVCVCVCVRVRVCACICICACLYAYVCMYVRMYVCICVYVCISIVYMHVFMHMYICTYVCIYVCMYVYTHVCMYVCMYVYM
jgi:hypothetical protein